MINEIIRLTVAICGDCIENLLDGSHWVLAGMAYPVPLSWFCVKTIYRKLQNLPLYEIDKARMASQGITFTATTFYF